MPGAESYEFEQPRDGGVSAPNSRNSPGLIAAGYNNSPAAWAKLPYLSDGEKSAVVGGDPFLVVAGADLGAPGGIF